MMSRSRSSFVSTSMNDPFPLDITPFFCCNALSSSLDNVYNVEEQVKVRSPLHTSVISLLTGESIPISLDSFLLRLFCWFFFRASEN